MNEGPIHWDIFGIIGGVLAVFAIVIFFIALPTFAKAQVQLSVGIRVPLIESAEMPEVERSGPIPSPTLKRPAPTAPAAPPGVETRTTSSAPSAAAEGAPAAAAVASENLVPNPSLELSDAAGLPTSWKKGGYGTNTRTHSYPVSPHTGAKAAQVSITSYTSGDAKWFFTNVPVAAGETYAFSNFSLADVPTEIDVEFTKSDGTKSYKVLASVPASAAYQETSAQFVVPAGATSLTIFHVLNKVGSLTIDDYSLSKVDTGGEPPPPPPSANPVPNGDLETLGTGGNPASWAKGGFGTNTRTYSYPVTGVGGSKAAQVSIGSYTSGDAKWYFTPIKLAAGSYVYSNQYQSNIPSVIAVQIHNADGSYTYKTVGSFAAAGSFTAAQGSFVVPSGTLDVTVFHMIRGVGTLTVDNAAITASSSTPPPPSGGIFTTGAVTFRIDDGLNNHYTVAAPALESKGFKGTFYIATRQLRDYGFTGYMSRAEVKALHDRGHEMGGHTRTHADLARLSPSQQQQEIQGSRDDLLALGVTPVSAFSYPFGSYTATTIGLVRDAGFTSAASTINGLVRPADDHYQLPRRGILVGTSVAQMKAWVDEAIAQRLWLILTFHGLDYSGGAYTTTPEKFREIVEYVAAKGVPVVTVSEGLAHMNP